MSSFYKSNIQIKTSYYHKGPDENYHQLPKIYREMKTPERSRETSPCLQTTVLEGLEINFLNCLNGLKSLNGLKGIG